jgi:thioredoxin 1
MALCCIGGVCVPYTAVVPILLMALRWFVGKLAEYGLLPKSVLNLLGTGNSTGTTTSTTSTGTSRAKQGRSCEQSQSQQPLCNDSADSCCASASNALGESRSVIVIESVQHFDTLLKAAANETVVIKFTATWCMPCKKIAPIYKELAEIYDAHFMEVDVDELSRVGAQFKVTGMPTFCIVANGESTVGKMSGSNEQTLRSFMANHLTKRKSIDCLKRTGVEKSRNHNDATVVASIRA